jgi:hypothetical protein
MKNNFFLNDNELPPRDNRRSVVVDINSEREERKRKRDKKKKRNEIKW